MQNGSMIRAQRQKGPDVWEYRWREAGGDGKRKHRRIVVGSVNDFVDEATADLPGNRYAVATFNLGEKPITVDRTLASLGFREGRYYAKNAWTGKRFRVSSRLAETLEPHASTVVILNSK